MHANAKRRLIMAASGVGLGMVLSLAFAAYLRPSFVVDLANRFMLCF